MSAVGGGDREADPTGSAGEAGLTAQRVWTLFAILAGVSFAIQVAMPVDPTDRPRTSFDTAPRGHAAVHALLDRFDYQPLPGVVLEDEVAHQVVIRVVDAEFFSVGPVRLKQEEGVGREKRLRTQSDRC